MGSETRQEHSFDERVARVTRYLHSALDGSSGPLYVKSRFVAEDLALTAKQVGAVMQRLAEESGGRAGRECGLDVEPWAYSGGTTWRVEKTA